MRYANGVEFFGCKAPRIPRDPRRSGRAPWRGRQLNLAQVPSQTSALALCGARSLGPLGRCVEWSCGHGMFPKELGIRLSCAWWPCGLCLVESYCFSADGKLPKIGNAKLWGKVSHGLTVHICTHTHTMTHTAYTYTASCALHVHISSYIIIYSCPSHPSICVRLPWNQPFSFSGADAIEVGTKNGRLISAWCSFATKMANGQWPS